MSIPSLFFLVKIGLLVHANRLLIFKGMLKKIIISATATLLLWFSVFFYLRYTGRTSQIEVENYLRNVVPEIFADWNSRRLFQELHPLVLTNINRTQVDSDFQHFARVFNHFQAMEQLKGNVTVTLTMKGRKIYGSYSSRLKFKTGSIKLEVSLTRSTDGWKIMKFRFPDTTVPAHQASGTR